MEKIADQKTIIENEIFEIAGQIFSTELIQEFVGKFKDLSSSESIKSYFLQVSTDQGSELELSFFNSTNITDITLSNARVYNYSYPLKYIKSVSIVNTNIKATLNIQGEKKLDYNVVHPGSLEQLERFESDLKVQLSKVNPDLLRSLQIC